MGNGVGSDANREAAHHFTFGMDVALFATVIAYVGRRAFDPVEAFGKSMSERWGPFVLVCLGCVALILDPIRHMLLDHGGVFFKEMDLAMYNNTGGLTPIGVAGQVASITGMVLLLSGILWHMEVPQAVMGKFSSNSARKTL